MATRSRIGVQNPDGTITSIYCHWDGYPDNNGVILQEHYRDASKISQLMDLGDLSSLGAEIGVEHDFNAGSDNDCTAYGRDRGERNVSAKTHKDLSEYLALGEEYNYLYQDGSWFVESDSSKGLVLLEDVLSDSEEFFDE